MSDRRPTGWDAYEHQPTRVDRVHGARQLGLVSAPGIVEPCACGGEISLIRRRELEAAIRAHNATGQHTEWRRRAEEI